MAINLSQLLKDADDIIEKRASKKPDESTRKDDISKLAEELKASSEDTEWTPQEKLAQAIMLVSTYANLPQLAKLAQFEAKALKAGYDESAIESFLEKRAGAEHLVDLRSLIPWLAE